MILSSKFFKMIIDRGVKYLFQTHVIRRGPEWWNNLSGNHEKILSPKQEADKIFFDNLKKLDSPLEYTSSLGEKIQILKSFDGKSISVLKAKDSGQSIGFMWAESENIKSVLTLTREDNWTFLLGWKEVLDTGEPRVREPEKIDITQAKQILKSIDSRVSEWTNILKKKRDEELAKQKKQKQEEFNRLKTLAYESDQEDAAWIMTNLMEDESIS